MLSILSICICLAWSKVFFHEQFLDESWEDRWVRSKSKGSYYYGKFKWTAGNYYADEKLDKGLMTKDDSKHYAIAAKFDEELSTEDGDVVIQFSLKNTHDMRYPCIGAYLKTGPHDTLLDLTDFDEKTDYSVMFGPDFCGTDQKFHLIVAENRKNLDWKNTEKHKVPERLDRMTHVYTFIIEQGKDKRYQFLFDGEVKERGNLKNDWSLKEPEELVLKFGWVGIEIWQVQAGSLFDNFYFGDDKYEAKKERDKILKRMYKEKNMFDDVENSGEL